jgi:hypothetical protein
MGRQIAVALSEEAEDAFLKFLRQTAEIQLILPFAETKDALFVDQVEPRGSHHWSHYIWNKTFPWQPEFAQTRSDLPPDRRGRYYVSNKSAAPILEYSRHNFDVPASRGRIYWSKYFSAPDGPAYDVDSFERWYESVVRWLRKHQRVKGPGP